MIDKLSFKLFGFFPKTPNLLPANAQNCVNHLFQDDSTYEKIDNAEINSFVGK